MPSDVGAQIQDLVSRFVHDVRELAFRAAQEALTNGLRPRGTAPKGAGIGRAVGTAKVRGGRRRRSGDELERRAGEFFGFVSQNPGMRIEEINAALGMTTTELRLPIRKLLRDRTIRAEGRLRGTRYFPR